MQKLDKSQNEIINLYRGVYYVIRKRNVITLIVKNIAVKCEISHILRVCIEL